MAYVNVNATSITTAGIRIDGQGTAGSAGGEGTGLKFSNDGNTVLSLENTGANTPNVVIVTGGTKGGYAVADQTIAMVANQNQFAGPWPKSTFDQPGSDAGYVYIYFTGSNEADVLVLPVKI